LRRGGGSVVGFARLVFFGREQVAKFQQAVETFDGAAMEALGLGLKAKNRGGDVGLPAVAMEAEGEPVGAVLVEGDIEAVGEEAGFEDRRAAHGVLGDGDAFDGVALLGVDGLVGGDGVGDAIGSGGHRSRSSMAAGRWGGVGSVRGWG
jgi:hypothetical protein